MKKKSAAAGRTVLITGGGRGIGAACARAFAAQGDSVAIACNSSVEQAQKLAAELNQGDWMPGEKAPGEKAPGEKAPGEKTPGEKAPGEKTSGEKTPLKRPRAIVVQGDITKSEQVAAMLAQIKEQLGSVEVLVNNAGISELSLFTDISEEQWDRMMNINCKSVFLCTKEVLPDMISEKRGVIVNISSMWGQVGASCEVHYSASKAAVIGMTKALAKEVGPSNIRVNCVAPGVIETDMMAGFSESVKKELAEDTPLMRLGTPEDVAEVVRFLASDAAAFLTGQIIGANGGFVV